MLNELHLMQYYYNYEYVFLNIHKIMLPNYVHTEVVVGSL